jgi:hypothetical protein
MVTAAAVALSTRRIGHHPPKASTPSLPISRPQVLRLLIEAAWHHRKPYRNPGPTMRARWDMTQSPTRRRVRESFSLITRATAPCSGSRTRPWHPAARCSGRRAGARPVTAGA